MWHACNYKQINFSRCIVGKISFVNLYYGQLVFALLVLFVFGACGAIHQYSKREYAHEKWLMNPSHPRIKYAVLLTLYALYSVLTVLAILVVLAAVGLPTYIFCRLRHAKANGKLYIKMHKGCTHKYMYIFVCNIYIY